VSSVNGREYSNVDGAEGVVVELLSLIELGDTVDMDRTKLLGVVTPLDRLEATEMVGIFHAEEGAWFPVAFDIRIDPRVSQV